MRVSAHQPVFLPWVGFWNKVVTAPTCVVLNDVKYSRGDWMNRSELKGMMLTVPVIGATSSTTIREAVINPMDVHKIARSIRQLLPEKKYHYADRLYPVIKYLESAKTTSLMELNTDLLHLIAVVLGIEVCWIPGRVPIGDSATERLQSMLGMLTEDVEYYSGKGGWGYFNRDDWSKGPVYMQDVKPQVQDTMPSILQLIAVAENPLNFVKDAATWTLYE